MLRILLILTCFVSRFSAFQFDICEAFSKTKEQLSHAAVVIVGFRDETLEKKAFETSDILKTFYECYGHSGGLEVRSAMFGRKWNTSRDGKECEMVGTAGLQYELFARKKVRLVFPHDLDQKCHFDQVISNIYPLFSRNDVLRYMYCSRNLCWIQKKNRILMEIQSIQIVPKTPIYEQLEMQVDSLAETGNQSVARKSSSNYKYFMKFSPQKNKENKDESVSQFLIVELIVGTLLLILLVYEAYGLVIDMVLEDFWNRNEEQEWHIIQQQIRDIPPDPSIQSSSESSSFSSTQSMSSSCQSDYSLQETQPSETKSRYSEISTLSTARIDETS